MSIGTWKTETCSDTQGGVYEKDRERQKRAAVDIPRLNSKLWIKDCDV